MSEREYLFWEYVDAFNKVWPTGLLAITVMTYIFFG